MFHKTTTALALSLCFMVTNILIGAEILKKTEFFRFSKVAKHTVADHVIRLESSFDPIFRRNGVDCNSHFVIKRQEKIFNFKTHQDELRIIKSVIVCNASQYNSLTQKLNKPGSTYIKVTGEDDWRCKEGLWFEIESSR